jgi:TolB protein
MKKSNVIIICISLFCFLFNFSLSAQEKIVFAKNREIHSMNIDGTDVKQLTNYKVPGHTPISCRPSIAKDGTVAYIYDPVRHGWMSTYKMKLNGTQKRRISKEPNSKASSTWNSVISPNKKYYVFVSTRSRKSEIYRMNADGSSVINISKSKAENGSPKWSPNGKHIIYVEENTKGGSDIILIDTSGKNRKILVSSSKELKNVAFSKDGKMIAYTIVVGRYADLMIANSKGKNAEKLKTISKWSRVSFSSDNTSIAFVTKNDRIATMKLNGSNYKELVAGIDPVWSY